MSEKKFLDVIRKWADKHNFWFPNGEMEELANEISKVALPSPEPEKWCECEQKYPAQIHSIETCLGCGKPIKPPEKKELPQWVIDCFKVLVKEFPDIISYLEKEKI